MLRVPTIDEFVSALKNNPIILLQGIVIGVFVGAISGFFIGQTKGMIDVNFAKQQMIANENKYKKIIIGLSEKINKLELSKEDGKNNGKVR